MDSPRRSVNETFVEGEHYRIDESGCWVWLKGRLRDGYGQCWLGKTRRAHRVSYERHRGPIPTGLTIDHLCRNRACINPDHLEVVPHQENVARGLNSYRLRTTCVRGEHDITVPANVLVRKDGSRTCRQCQLARQRECWRRQRDRRVA